MFEQGCSRLPAAAELPLVLLVVLVLCIALSGCAHLRRQHVLGESYLLELEKMGWRASPNYGDIPWFLQPLRDLGMANEDDWLVKWFAHSRTGG